MTSEQIDSLWTTDDPVVGYQNLVRALGDNPISADEIRTQICRSLGVQGKFSEAWAQLAQVSDRPADIVSVRVLLESGRLKYSSGDKTGAILYFQMALIEATDNHFDYYAIDAAQMLAIATHGDESVRWNERALAMSAASTDARARQWRGSLLNNLAWTYFEARDYAKALETFEAAPLLSFREEADNPVAIRIARWAVARCLRATKRYEDALVILEDLIRFPEVGYVSEELAENLLAMGKTDQARPHFRRAYESLSKSEYLREHEQARLQRMNELAGPLSVEK
jgi:tetratricopeptide (TPR) repeat protein